MNRLKVYQNTGLGTIHVRMAPAIDVWMAPAIAPLQLLQLPRLQLPLQLWKKSSNRTGSNSGVWLCTKPLVAMIAQMSSIHVGVDGLQGIMVLRALVQRVEARCWLFDNRLRNRCNLTERSWLGQVYERCLPRRKTMIAGRHLRRWQRLALQ